MKENLHVLIIDDDPDDQEFLAGAFSRMLPSTRFTTAPNGQAALDVLLKNDGEPADCPDVAFLDLHMPGMSGYQVLVSLRASAQCKDFPVMVISTSLMRSEVEKCKEAGCTHYFTKPVSLEEYDNIVATTLVHLHKSDG